MIVLLLFLLVIPSLTIVLLTWRDGQSNSSSLLHNGKETSQHLPPKGKAVKPVDTDDKKEKKKAPKETKTPSPPPQSKQTPMEVEKEEKEVGKEMEVSADAPRILIAYASNTTNAYQLSNKLFNQLQEEIHLRYTTTSSSSKDGGIEPPTTPRPVVKILELRQEEPKSSACTLETLLDDPRYCVVIFVVSTFTDGLAPPRSQSFELLLKDAFEDHRVSRDSLSQKKFALFGLGDVMYGETRFNAFAKHLHEYCRGLGAPNFVVPPVYATDEKLSSLFKVFSTALLKWFRRVEFVPVSTDASKEASAATRYTVKIGKRTAAATPNTTASSPVEEGEVEEGEEEDDTSPAESDEDIEDLLAGAEADHPAGEKRELLYPRLQKNLEKQGYQIIGSHSAVKLCRWTKSMLRGRGGCYKYTFYNIKSFQCMELTPSLACANKCVFCWRHHTNPVSTYFKWKQDDAEFVLQTGLLQHQKMIKQLKSVPGVTDERLEEAKTVRHCALSLVGEPIMYPQINTFCHLLHEHKISSFMVTNAQFPSQLRNLIPVVQLYLSIDAPTSEEIKKIDRPLFEDYWERCLACTEELRKKRQRTVFRLTLINEENDSNINNYADLVQRGWPDFIEVKGVTFCGTSNSNTINMKTHVPRHDQVIQFCQRLCAVLAERYPHYQTPQMEGVEPEDEKDDNNVICIPPEERHRPYHIACEHEHSCCVLIALDKFYFNQCWNTWIDYDKFYTLAAQHTEPEVQREAVVTAGGEEDNHNHAAANGTPLLESDINYESNKEDFDKYAHYNHTFTSLDYASPTPRWATYRSSGKGFDPSQTRMLGKKARPVAITSGC